MSFTGSCLCGEVTFEISRPFHTMGHCYCSLCRKPRSGTYRHWALLASNQFRWTAGTEYLETCEYAPGREHLRCRQCGDVLVSNEEGVLAKVAVDAVDMDARAVEHIFVGSQAVWHEIADHIHQY